MGSWETKCTIQLIKLHSFVLFVGNQDWKTLATTIPVKTVEVVSLMSLAYYLTPSLCVFVRKVGVGSTAKLVTIPNSQVYFLFGFEYWIQLNKIERRLMVFSLSQHWRSWCSVKLA